MPERQKADRNTILAARAPLRAKATKAKKQNKRKENDAKSGLLSSMQDLMNGMNFVQEEVKENVYDAIDTFQGVDKTINIREYCEETFMGTVPLENTSEEDLAKLSDSELMKIILTVQDYTLKREALESMALCYKRAVASAQRYMSNHPNENFDDENNLIASYDPELFSKFDINTYFSTFDDLVAGCGKAGKNKTTISRTLRVFRKDFKRQVLDFLIDSIPTMRKWLLNANYQHHLVLIEAAFPGALEGDFNSATAFYI